MKRTIFLWVIFLASTLFVYAKSIFAADLYLNQPLSSAVYATENGGIIVQNGCMIGNGVSAILIADHHEFQPGFHIVSGGRLVILIADYDGLPDTWEAEHFGNLNQGPGDDFDGDLLSNLLEYQLGTDPTNPDTDNDGMPDGWESQHGLNPLTNDASGDLDGDLFSNYTEYVLGTEPDDENSLPAPGHYYSYDELERITRDIYLSGTQIQYIIEYEYDSVGNRISRIVKPEF